MKDLEGSLKGQSFEKEFFAENVIGKKVSQFKTRLSLDDFSRFKAKKLLKRKDELLGKERKIQQTKK